MTAEPRTRAGRALSAATSPGGPWEPKRRANHALIDAAICDIEDDAAATAEAERDRYKERFDRILADNDYDLATFRRVKAERDALRAEVERLREALEAVTNRRDCGHGHIDVSHVYPFHFDGPVCRSGCCDPEYAERRAREEPCVICAALAAPPSPALDATSRSDKHRETDAHDPDEGTHWTGDGCPGGHR